MHCLLTVLSVSVLAGSIIALPFEKRQSTMSGVNSGGNSNPSGTFQCYKGSQFPEKSTWATWDALWKINLPDMKQDNSDAENEMVASTIQSIANAAGVDPRIVLAQAMQETKGGLHKVAGDGKQSYGILQCKVPNPGDCSTVKPCPQSEITKMINGGVLGSSTGGTAQEPGIAAWMTKENGNVGAALRGYNTGGGTAGIPNLNDFSDVGAATYTTPSYVSSVGNRLMGVTDANIPQQAGQLSQCGFHDPA